MARWLTVTGVPTSLEAWRALPLQQQADLRTIRDIENSRARMPVLPEEEV